MNFTSYRSVCNLSVLVKVSEGGFGSVFSTLGIIWTTKSEIYGWKGSQPMGYDVFFFSCQQKRVRGEFNQSLTVLLSFCSTCPPNPAVFHKPVHNETPLRRKWGQRCLVLKPQSSVFQPNTLSLSDKGLHFSIFFGIRT